MQRTLASLAADPKPCVSGFRCRCKFHLVRDKHLVPYLLFTTDDERPYVLIVELSDFAFAVFANSGI